MNDYDILIFSLQGVPMEIKLNKRQVNRLLELDPSIEPNGGFQKFAIRLRHKLNPETGVLSLTDSDVRKAHDYITKYGKGGWQSLYKDLCRQAVDN